MTAIGIIAAICAAMGVGSALTFWYVRRRTRRKPHRKVTRSLDSLTSEELDDLRHGIDWFLDEE